MKKIENKLFYGCASLTSFTIPNSVTIIGDSAFYNCWSIKQITIPNSVLTIGKSSFSNCDNLESIFMGNCVTNIDRYCFNACHNIKSVHISDMEAWCLINFANETSNPLYYANRLFLNDMEIKDLSLPKSLTKIGNYTFTHCNSLISVTIPNGVESIGEYAFWFCDALESVDIPNSVTKIGPCAFGICHSLSSIIIPNSVKTIDIMAYYECVALSSVIIGDSVTSIGASAFEKCISLKQITIPNNVRYLGDRVFDSVDFTSIISLIENPFDITASAYGGPFDTNTITNAILYVPVGSIEKYEMADGWRDFHNIVEGTPSGGTKVDSDALQIKADAGMVNIKGIAKNTLIKIYNTNGTLIGSTISHDGFAKIDAKHHIGSIVLVKVGEKSFKMIIK